MHITYMATRKRNQINTKLVSDLTNNTDCFHHYANLWSCEGLMMFLRKNFFSLCAYSYVIPYWPLYKKHVFHIKRLWCIATTRYILDLTVKSKHSHRLWDIKQNYISHARKILNLRCFLIIFIFKNYCQF